MDYLPIFVDLKGRKALLVGGGETALQKLRLLRRAGAALTVVTPEPSADIDALAQAGEIVLERRAFAAEDVRGCAVVIGATADPAVATAAREAGIPVNIVDHAELSTFIVPAIIDRSPIVVGISSGGAAPLLARLLRAKLELELPARLGDLARFAQRFRGAVRAVIGDAPSRRRFWERFFASPAAEQVLAGNERAAREAMLPLLNRTSAHTQAGAVYLVGAGPGDPDLLTGRALRLMQQADVVFYDELIGPEILDRVRRDALRVYVGKTKGRHAYTQDEINQALLREAKAGRRVLRLKGGDPFVFGRGGEEMNHVRRHGIEVIVAPGITAAIGCLADAGIPLTHRDYASSVTFVTGHTRDGADTDWASLAKGDRTLVVYMGLSRAGAIADQLMAGGLDRATPVAIIQNGTLPTQTVVTGVVRDLEALAAPLAGQGPALLVVGKVVTLAAAWGQQPAQAKVAV